MPSGDDTTQLIVTADDFNLSEGVSRGILEAHYHGIVTETSVMVNLGDCASGPLWPRETIQWLMDTEVPTVRGNHDRYLVEGRTDLDAADEVRHVGLVPAADDGGNAGVAICGWTPFSTDRAGGVVAGAWPRRGSWCAGQRGVRRGHPGGGRLPAEAEPDKGMIEAALQRARGVISQAAADLGLSRQALYRRMEKMGIGS